jgi:trigger factor
MDFKVSDGEKYQKIMEAEIPAEELAFAMRQASKRLSARLNIPGFRKGKAPQSIIENFVGLEALLNEAADEVVPRAYVQGLEELALDPVDKPKVEIVRLAVNEPLVFTATFTAKPEVGLGQYRGLPLTLQVREVAETEIDADIETQRRRLSRLSEAEEGAETMVGDALSINFEGFLNGEPFEGGRADNYPLELGSHSFIPGFEEQLGGMRVGDEREIQVVFPEDYQQTDLAGQPVMFRVSLNSFKRRLWPDLDDDFAQEVSETAESMEDLRREVAERLQERNKKAAERQAKDDVVSLAAANALMDLPPLMIERRVDSMVQNMAGRLQAQGLQMQQFLEYSGQTAQSLRESYTAQAEKDVRGDLTLEAVAKAENISASAEDVEHELQIMADYYQQTMAQINEAFAEQGRLEVLKIEILMNKAADFLYSSAEITEITVSAGAEEETGELVDA